MNIITLNRVLLNNTPLNYRRKRILTEKDFYFKTIERTFTFSKSAGGKSIKDGRAYIKRIKGNSVVWNQLLLQTNNYVESGVTSSWNDNICTLSGESSSTYINITSKRIPCSLNEKFALIAEQIANPNDILFKIGLFNSSNDRAILGNGVTSSAIIVNSQYASKGSGFGVDYFGGVGTDLTGIQFKVKLISLTKMFGAGNEPSTIEEFNARVATLGVDLNAYNEGEVIHCNTESIKSVGDNAWDEQWESGRYTPSTGLPNIDEGIRSKNSIKVLPNENYWCSAQNDIFAHFYDSEGNLITNVYSGQYNYLPIKGKQFTTPANAATMTFYVVGTTTYNHDILISLYHSGWKAQKDDQYQPYWQDTLPLPIIRKYFPDGMKSAGTAHDEIRYNKATQKWEAVKRIGEVDLGTLDWILTSQMYFRALLPSDSIAPTNTDYNGFICAKYERVDFNLIYGQRVASPCFGIPANNPVCCVVDSSYTDAASFKTAMQGVMLYYELAEPIVTELDAEDQNFRDYYQVADFGTEQSQSSVPSAALLADVGYYFKKSEVKELTLN